MPPAPSALPTFLTYFKRLDLYRSIPHEYAERQSLPGGFVSLVSVVVILLLFLSELLNLFTIRTVHELTLDSGDIPTIGNVRGTWAGSLFAKPMVDQPLHQNRIKINFNITFPAIPCALTQFVVQDVLGSSLNNDGGRGSIIHKYRTDSHGQIKMIKTQPLDHGVVTGPVFEKMMSGDGGRAEDQIDEGCCIVGHVHVKKVPGNIHFTANAHHPNVRRPMPIRPSHGGKRQLQAVHPSSHAHGHSQGGPGHSHGPVGGGHVHLPVDVDMVGSQLNTSHLIHSFWFGETTELADLEMQGGRRSAFAPLNGGVKLSLPSELSDGNGKSYEYFLRVIPTEYHRYGSSPVSTYQYVSNSNEIVGRYRVPSIFFRYDFEPIRVKLTEKYPTTFAKFFVSCCAIIGGVYSVLRILNMAVKQGFKSLAGGGTSASGKSPVHATKGGYRQIPK